MVLYYRCVCLPGAWRGQPGTPDCRTVFLTIAGYAAPAEIFYSVLEWKKNKSSAEMGKTC